MPPITTESFRDPRRLFAVRVLSGFCISGREPTKIGEIVHLPRSLAHEVVNTGKAEFHVETVSPVPVQTPAVAPAAETAPPPAPSKSSASKEK